jgi:LCP family protein required for cell wall assembly
MIILIILALGLVGGIAFSYKILAAGNKITVANRSIFGQLKDLLLSSDQKLHGESDGRINILLLAIGGEGHSGENLTDTIMVASIRPSDHSVALLSIPRDLYVKVPGENFYSKLNAVHAYGEAKQHDLGPVLIKQKVEEITGLPIHYFARVDFTAFKSLVDAVGGIHITIPTTFFDYWHKISFPAGTEDMNGDRALAYVRARYIEGPEGGDFKRAGRQQQVLLAIRDKIFSVSTALDFTKLNKILDSLSNNVRTDMQLWEIKRFYEMARQIDTSKIKSVVLSNARDGVLVSSTEILGGQPAYILKTRTGDYSEIQAIAKNIFSPDVGSSLAPSAGDAGTTPPPPADAGDIAPLVSDTPTPSPSASPAAAVTTTVEVRNGTTITGLAKKTADTLQAKGYTITGTGNAKQRNATATTVYAVSQDHQAQASAISQLLNATLDTKLPTGESASKADVVVILGSDAK